MTEHWTANAERIGDSRWAASDPFLGLVAENEDGMLLLPAWRNPHVDDFPGGWWNRRLDLRNPLHWFPYLRSRRTNALVWVEAP